MAMTFPVFPSKSFDVYNRVYTTFDTFLYYVFNVLMCVVIFGEVILEQLNLVMYLFNIVKALMQHKFYNNIN